MAAKMASCSIAILVAKCIWCTYSIEIFISVFVGQFYEEKVALVQSRSLELH